MSERSERSERIIVAVPKAHGCTIGAKSTLTAHDTSTTSNGLTNATVHQ